MNFDIFDEINFPETHKEKILSSAKAAERNILVSPNNALFNARVAIENLCKALIDTNHIEFSVNINGDSGLLNMIDACVNAKAFTKKDDAHSVRMNGNIVSHGDGRKKDTIKAEKLHIVNTENVELAMRTVRSLYDIFLEVFSNQVLVKKFDKYSVPFGDFEIVRCVHKGKNEVIFGPYNYFVKDPKNNYYYFQVLHRNSDSVAKNELCARSVLASNHIKKDKKRTSYLLDVYYPSILREESDRDYIAYPVYSDSKLLSEIKSKVLSEKQTLQVAIDILNALLELKRIGKGIHLRNIQPCNVIITPDENEYFANVVNMETAKINSYETTVFASMKGLIETNPYLPREARNERDSKGVQWEKVDVYSVAMLMVYCMDDSAVKENIDTDSLYDIFSDNIVDILIYVFNSSINEIDGVEEFKERLEDALKEL